MFLHMVADKEVDKVADMVACHGRWLIGPKLFRPEAYPTCVSSKLCEFIWCQGELCIDYQTSRFLSRNFLLNITGWVQMIHLYDISTFVALVRFDRISLYPQNVAEERKPSRCVSLHVRTAKEEDGC